MKRSLLVPPTLYDFQLYCVSPVLCRLSALLTNIGIAVYTIPQQLLCPTVLLDLAGIGIRLAQDVGVHRRKVHNHTLTIDDELWKRAFWYVELTFLLWGQLSEAYRMLVYMDRILSSSLGRPCAIQDEEYEPSLFS